MHKTGWLFGLLIGVVGFGVITLDARDSPSPVSASPSIILKPCPGFSQTGKPPLVYGAQCGELPVKENPADINSRTINLNILRLPAISPTPQADPLLLIQGGPGGSSVAMAEMLHSFFNGVRKERDLIFIDQRGTGKSHPLECGNLTEAEQLLPDAEQASRYLQLLKTCASQFQSQASFYTTPYAVDDLHRVKAALGYDRINLWGGSYGTRVALEYARQFSQDVRSMILDGVAPVQMALPKYFAEDATAALQAVNRECQADDKCRNRYGDIMIKAQKVVTQLQAIESQQQSLTVEFEHPQHQTRDKLLLTAKHFSELLFMALYSRDLTALLPQAIADAEQGQYRLIAALSSLAKEQSSFLGISEGMRYSIICNEDAHFISPQDIATAKPFFGMNMLKDISEVCAFWPKASLPDNYFQPIASAAPALLLAGNHDPVTPLRWAQQAAQQLPNSLILEAPGGNHAISTDGCLPDLIAQFINLADTQKLTTACVKSIKPLPPILGANTKNAEPVVSPPSP